MLPDDRGVVETPQRILGDVRDRFAPDPVLLIDLVAVGFQKPPRLVTVVMRHSEVAEDALEDAQATLCIVLRRPIDAVEVAVGEPLTFAIHVVAWLRSRLHSLVFEELLHLVRVQAPHAFPKLGSSTPRDAVALFGHRYSVRRQPQRCAGTGQ